MNLPHGWSPNARRSEDNFANDKLPAADHNQAASGVILICRPRPMKNHCQTAPAWGVFVLLLTPLLAEPKPLRLAGLPSDDPAFKVAPITLTREDLADPPDGEIRKQYLSEVNELRAALKANLAAAPAAAEGQESPWMSKFQALRTGLDRLAASRLQRDLFDLIPLMKDLFNANGKPGFSDYFVVQTGLVLALRVSVIEAVAEHVSDQNAKVAESDLADFVTIFCDYGFVCPTDWEGATMPIDPAGIMILDPAAVVTQLKALPWKQAERFLGNHETTETFEDYESTGSGLAVLKTKLAAHQPDILAKWRELADWVAQQRLADPSGALGPEADLNR